MRAPYSHLAAHRPASTVSPQPEPDPVVAAFAKRLAELREAKKTSDPKWTQGYVAKRLGVRQEAVSKWETAAKEIGFANFARLCDVLQCSADDLLGRSGSPRDDAELVEMIESLQRLVEQLRRWRARSG